jgi:hypothetical protein
MKINLLLGLFIVNINLCFAQIGRDKCKIDNNCLDGYYCKRINNKACLDCQQNCNLQVCN